MKGLAQKVRLGQKLTPEGKRVLQILQVEYLMTKEAALRLIRDGGILLATAMLRRGH